jgi:hypothetical protein
VSGLSNVFLIPGLVDNRSWLLDGGEWNDFGKWIDTEVWED